MDYKFWSERNRLLITKDYMSEEDAKAALKSFERQLSASADAHGIDPESNYYFCPIINGTCRKACICYKEHMVVTRWDRAQTPAKQIFKITDWECRNIQVTGLVYIEKN